MCECLHFQVQFSSISYHYTNYGSITHNASEVTNHVGLNKNTLGILHYKQVCPKKLRRHLGGTVMQLSIAGDQFFIGKFLIHLHISNLINHVNHCFLKGTLGKISKLSFLMNFIYHVKYDGKLKFKTTKQNKNKSKNKNNNFCYACIVGDLNSCSCLEHGCSKSKCHNLFNGQLVVLFVCLFGWLVVFFFFFL